MKKASIFQRRSTLVPQHFKAARELCVDAINAGAETWGADAFVIADEDGKHLTYPLPTCCRSSKG
jgi:hypothetical protein